MKIHMLYLTLDVDSRVMFQRLLSGAPIDIRVDDLFCPLVMTRDPSVDDYKLQPIEFVAQMTGVDFLYSSVNRESTATVSLHAPELLQFQLELADQFKGVASLHESVQEQDTPPFIALCRGGSLSGNQRRWLSSFSTTLATQPPIKLVNPQVTLRDVS